ncbi:hypothetical protein [Catellatospora chokoriensis]|uniref:hypothetical protein n=1 Tax=Catellatospora chokoriensis TaxID=310353 RepID=UPI001783F656|nr:hypothetical protein [Catellatospora chokoriensis]
MRGGSPVESSAVLAFHAREPPGYPGYPGSDSVKAAWDIEAIRSEHLDFIDTWADPSAEPIII